MARTAISGLTSIEYVAIPSNGSIPATGWARYGDTLKGTCNIETSDPETSTVEAEEVDQPIQSTSKAGTTTLSFTVVNPSETAIVALMGGTYDSENGEWSAPAQAVETEVEIRFTAKTGHKIIYPRVKLTGKLSGDLTADGVLGFACTGTVLSPTGSGVPPYKIVDPS